MSKLIPLSLGTVTTAIPAGIENDEAPSVRWNRTIRALERVDWQISWMEHPTFGCIESYKGRHVIGRDRPIIEGVYIGAFQREAIVVSEVSVTEGCYFSLLGKLKMDDSEEQKIRAIHAHVRATLPLGTMETQAVVHKGGLPEDRKICLSVFISARAGVCRHRALLAGYFLERLVRDGLLHGSVSVDRNETDEGGHAWARFVSRQYKGCVWIIDAGLDVCGQLFHLDENRWSYARPEDTAVARVVATIPTPVPKATPEQAPNTAPAQTPNGVQTPMTLGEFTLATVIIALLASSYLWNYG